MKSVLALSVVLLPGLPAAGADQPALPPVSFTNDVMAVLAKAGCNAGTCHGHNSGKGGFKLSLRGYDPAADHKALTGADFGRVDLQEPEQSLILWKATGRQSHRGGKRFEVGSEFYEVLKRWLAEGAREDVGRAVRLERIEVQPDSRLMTRPGLSQQLAVRAHFADGSAKDVTHLSAYELSHEGVVEADPTGLVTSKREGEAAVLVRFLGKLALGRFLVIQHRPDFAWADPPEHNFIDRHVYAKLRTIQVAPSELSNDAEFLRRVSLDTVGLPPTPEEVRVFLADARPDRRARKIDELLDREEFGDTWAAYWLELSGTTESGDSARFKGMWTLSLWLRDVINRNLPYDQFVRALVEAKGGSLANPAVTFSANRLAQVEVVPQLFLGTRLECAQCHDHPFDVWKQSDYNALREFFAGRTTKEGPGDPYGRELRTFVPPQHSLPWEKDKTVRLRFLDGSTADVPLHRDRRELLADWLLGPSRRQVARAVVNRVWGKLLGRGIVEPVDDMRFSNPPVNGPLLDALAVDFLTHRYDFKHLVRTVLNSRTYQLSSVPTAAKRFQKGDGTPEAKGSRPLFETVSNATERMNFSHARLRRLTAEQLLDAISQVTGVPEPLRVGPPGLRSVQAPYVSVGSRFLTLFGRPEQRMSPCECIRSQETTMAQVLHLLNGETVAGKLRAPGGTLSRLLAADGGDEALVENLYLTVLSRPPTDRERRLGRDALRGPDGRAAGAEDLMWALLNSPEFLFNH